MAKAFHAHQRGAAPIPEQRAIPKVPFSIPSKAIESFGPSSLSLSLSLSLAHVIFPF
jgi:hypothetical protein